MGLRELLELEQVSPEEWGAIKPYDGWSRRWTTNQMFVHWFGTPVSDRCARGSIEGEMAQIRSAERYHVKTKGWAGIAYDWIIGNSGTLYRARGLGRSAATGGDIDSDGIPNNSEAEGVCLLVGEGQLASQEALNTLSRVWATLGYDELYGHLESRRRGSGTSTTCPGPQLMQYVKDLRSGRRVAATRPSLKEYEVKLFRIDGGAAVYVTDGATKAHIPTREAFEAMGYKWEDVMDIPNDHPLAKLPRVG